MAIRHRYQEGKLSDAEYTEVQTELKKAFTPCSEIYQALYGRALNLTRSEDDASDLMHDTFCKAWKNHDKFDPGSDLRAWLFVILRNTFFNMCKKRQNGTRILLEAQEGAIDCPVIRPTHTMEEDGDGVCSPFQSEVSAQVKTALEQLPADFRTVVVLYDIRNLSYKEIAEIMDTPIGTVMSRLFRARIRLQEKLRNFAKENYEIGRCT